MQDNTRIELEIASENIKVDDIVLRFHLASDENKKWVKSFATAEKITRIEGSKAYHGSGYNFWPVINHIYVVSRVSDPAFPVPQLATKEITIPANEIKIGDVLDHQAVIETLQKAITPERPPYNKANLEIAEAKMRGMDKPPGLRPTKFTKEQSEAWSAALRFKQVEARKKDKYQVLCDIQDID